MTSSEYRSVDEGYLGNWVRYLRARRESRTV